MRSMILAGFVVAIAPVPAARATRAFAQTAANTVAIKNFTFTPQRLTAKAGATVIWTNADDIPHAVAAVDKAFKSKVLDTDGSYSFTFTTPGTYAYFCSLHPHMTGTIVVEPVTGDVGH